MPFEFEFEFEWVGKRPFEDVATRSSSSSEVTSGAISYVEDDAILCDVLCGKGTSGREGFGSSSFPSTYCKFSRCVHGVYDAIAILELDSGKKWAHERSTRSLNLERAPPVVPSLSSHLSVASTRTENHLECELPSRPDALTRDTARRREILVPTNREKNNERFNNASSAGRHRDDRGSEREHRPAPLGSERDSARIRPRSTVERDDDDHSLRTRRQARTRT